MLSDRRRLEYGTSDYADPRSQTIVDPHRVNRRPRYTAEHSHTHWHSTKEQEAIRKDRDPRLRNHIDERDTGHGYRAVDNIDGGGYKIREPVGNLDRRESRYRDSDTHRHSDSDPGHSKTDHYPSRDLRQANTLRNHDRNLRPTRDRQNKNIQGYLDKFKARLFNPKDSSLADENHAKTDRDPLESFSRADQSRKIPPIEDIDIEEYHRIPGSISDRRGYRDSEYSSERYGHYDRDRTVKSDRPERRGKETIDIFDTYYNDKNGSTETPRRRDRRDIGRKTTRSEGRNGSPLEYRRQTRGNTSRSETGKRTGRSEGRNGSPLEYRRETGGNTSRSETGKRTRRSDVRNRSPGERYRETGGNSTRSEHRNRSQAEYHRGTFENTAHSELRNKSQVNHRKEIRENTRLSDKDRTRSPVEQRELIKHRAEGRRTGIVPDQLEPKYRGVVEDSELQETRYRALAENGNQGYRVATESENRGQRVSAEGRNQRQSVPAESGNQGYRDSAGGGNQGVSSGRSIGRKTQKSYRSEDSKRSTQEDELRSLSTTPRMSHEDLGRIVSPPAADPGFKSRQTQLLELQMTQADETLKMIMMDADAVRRDLETEQEKNKTLLAQLDAIEEDKKDLNVKLATMRVKLGVANANLNVNKSESDQMRKKYQEAQIQKARLEERIKLSTADLDRLKDPDNPESNVNLKKVVLNERKEIRRLRTELEGIKSERSELQKQIEVKLQKLKQLEVDIAFVNEQLIITQDDFHDAMTSAENERLERQTIEEKYSELLKEKSEFDQEMETLNEQLETCVRETLNIHKVTEQYRQKEQMLLEKISTGEKKLRDFQAEVETHKNQNMPQRTASSIKYHQYRMTRTSVVSDTTPHVTVKADPKGSIQASGYLGKAIVSTKPVTTSLPSRSNNGAPGKQPPKGRGGSLPPKK